MFAMKSERLILAFLLTSIAGAYQMGLKQTDWMLEKTNSKILQNGTYITKNQLEQNYLRKDFVEKDYLPRQEVEAGYVPIAKLRKLESTISELTEKADLVDSALKSDSRQLMVKQIWHPKNPEFYVGFMDFMEGDDGPYAYIQISFVDSQPYQFTLRKYNSPKNLKFTYNGITYELATVLRMQNGEVFVDAALSQSSSKDSHAHVPPNGEA